MSEYTGVASQFGTNERRREAGQLGMWIFLGTELLLFGGLFAAYAYYRFVFPDAFAEAGAHLKPWEGLVMTLILATADLSASMGLRSAERGRNGSTAFFLLLAAFLGLVFLALHLHEYMDSSHKGELPGEWFHEKELQRPGASLFFTLFWLMTGLHMLHVTAGITVLVLVALGAMTLKFTKEAHGPVETGTMYWHFVDLIWTFLFPLLYLRP